jgi:CheY-like chemotaxis protein
LLICAAVRDNSERKRIEEALKEADRRKDEFLAMLSHELRNPLAPILNALQLLQLQKGENSVQQKAQAIIERQVGQLTHLVDDLLDVSRTITGRIQLRREQIAMSGIVERAVETVRPLIDQRKHELTVSLPPDPIWLDVDAARLEQVVTNLLTNAVKYTSVGGHIWLSVQQEGDKAVLRVRDTGLGITPAFLPHVFDLFTQAERSSDRSQGGLGIGLALVKRLVEMHEGTIEVFSTLGQGSEFVVSLPVDLPQALSPKTQPPPTEIAKPTRAALRVLIVDDNVDAASALEMLLQASGHLVRVAHTGPTGLAAAFDFRPDVMLLDIGLPELDGWKVAERIRQEPMLHDIVLVAMTGYGQNSDRQRSQRVGFDHHFVKPVDFGTLRQILAAVSEKAT